MILMQCYLIVLDSGIWILFGSDADNFVEGGIERENSL